MAEPTADLSALVGSYSLNAVFNDATTCTDHTFTSCNRAFTGTMFIGLSNGQLTMDAFDNLTYAGTYDSTNNRFLFPDPPATINQT